MRPIRLNILRPGRLVTLLPLVVLIAVAALAQSGGDYDISRCTIGGGGKSSSGDYVLFGTIGQPDAGGMSGGDYELLGGFWAGGPLCTVDFYHYARFAEWWLESPCNAGNDFCGGADLLPRDGVVDGNDLDLFVKQWLYYCPLDWSLK